MNKKHLSFGFIVLSMFGCATALTFDQMKSQSTSLVQNAAIIDLECADAKIEQSEGGERSRKFVAKGCGKISEYQTTCQDDGCIIASSNRVADGGLVAPPAPDAPVAPAAPTDAPAVVTPAPTPVAAPAANASIFTGKLKPEEWRTKLAELAGNDMTCPIDKLTVTAPAAGVEGTHKIEGCGKFVKYALDCGDDGVCAVLRAP
jgi:hypothetical protein